MTPPDLFDSHVHLDAHEFDADRGEVLRAARRAGVRDMLVPAIAADGWEGLHALCAADPHLHPAYGLHPLYLDRHRDADLDALQDWLPSHPACAVGECGLDFYAPDADRERQSRFLRAQLLLAHRLDLPVVLHARGAFEQTILELRGFMERHGPLRGVVHSFSGSHEQARQLWKLGFHIGIGGPVTYERARRLRTIVATMPIERLLLETDAPDQPDAAHRGRRNEPARLPEVLHCIAGLRGEPAAAIAAATSAAARRLFLGRA